MVVARTRWGGKVPSLCCLTQYSMFLVIVYNNIHKFLEWGISFYVKILGVAPLLFDQLPTNLVTFSVTCGRERESALFYQHKGTKNW